MVLLEQSDDGVDSLAESEIKQADDQRADNQSNQHDNRASLGLRPRQPCHALDLALVLARHLADLRAIADCQHDNQHQNRTEDSLDDDVARRHHKLASGGNRGAVSGVERNRKQRQIHHREKPEDEPSEYAFLIEKALYTHFRPLAYFVSL